MASPGAAAKLRELQSLPGNKICVDCNQKNPQWASVSLGVFMCLECSGKHRGLGVHISFVRSVTMDSWSDIQLRKMEVGGNDALNDFFLKYDIPKQTDIVVKYNSRAAEVYRSRIQALAEGRPWTAPPVEKSPLPRPVSSSNSRSRPSPGAFGSSDNWDDWGDGNASGGGFKRNASSSQDLPTRNASSMGPRTASAGELYTRDQLEASASRKESFFAQKQAENAARPEGVHPSQGGKYVGFGSTPSRPAPPRSALGDDVLGDTVKIMSQGISRLSVAAVSAAQSATVAVQVGSREIQAMVKEGGYDQKAVQTANAVVAKTSEIGQRTWGLVRNFAALATKTVENYSLDSRDSFTHNSSSGVRDAYSDYEVANTSEGEHFFSSQDGSNHTDTWSSNSHRQEYSSGPNGNTRSYASSGRPNRSENGFRNEDWDAWGEDNYQSASSIKKSSSYDTFSSPNQANNAKVTTNLASKSAAAPPPAHNNVDLLSGGNDWAGWDDDDDGDDKHTASKSTISKDGKDNEWDDWGFK